MPAWDYREAPSADLRAGREGGAPCCAGGAELAKALDFPIGTAAARGAKLTATMMCHGPGNGGRRRPPARRPWRRRRSCRGGTAERQHAKFELTSDELEAVRRYIGQRAQ